MSRELFRMKLSIVIPVKNEETRIEKCLKSIMSLKTVEDYELIIVDNGSTDNTVNIAKRYSNKVFIKNELTVAGLRNYGVTFAQGSIIAFVDADIEVDTNWALNALRILEGQESYCCLTGKINISPNPTWVEKTWGLNRHTSKSSFITQWASSMNMFIRKEIFQKIGGFNAKLITCEDVDISYRLRQEGGLIYYDESVRVTHHGEAKTLFDFFKKERWRGTSVFDGILSHGLTLDELPSLLQLFVFTICIFLAMLLTYFNIQTGVFYGMGCVIFLPILRALLNIDRKDIFLSFYKLIIVWAIYYFARLCAAGDNLIRIFKKVKSL